MSYLPSSQLYQREYEPKAAPEPVAEKPKPSAKRAPSTVVVEQTAPAVAAPPVAPPVAAPPAIAPPPVVPAPPRRVMMGSKEWLVAPAPTLHVDVPTPEPMPPVETVTVSASSTPSEEVPGRRNIFRRAHKVVLRHIDRAKSGAKNVNVGAAGEPELLWWAVMVTGSLCVGLMIWGAYNAWPRPGNGRHHLRADASPTRLTGTTEVPVHRFHDSGPIRPQPQPPLMHPVANPQPHPVPQPPPFAPTPVYLPPDHHAVRPPAPPAETPLEPLPERKDPVVFVHANLGDSPMIRTWKKIAESSVLLATLTAAANNNLMAQVPQVDYSKQIENLTKAVQTLSDQVSAMKLDEKLGAVKTELNDKISKVKAGDNGIDFQLLANRLDRLEKMITQLAAMPPVAAGAAPVVAGGNLDEIKMKLGNIEQAILRLQPERRIALAAPTQEPPVAAKSGTSHVIFVNLYNQDLWLWINQKQHRAPAGTTLTLDNITAGPATIEVRSPEGVFHKSTPTLVANETFTLTAR